jgi:hypothetical protein
LRQFSREHRLLIRIQTRQNVIRSLSGGNFNRSVFTSRHVRQIRHVAAVNRIDRVEHRQMQHSKTPPSTNGRRLRPGNLQGLTENAVPLQNYVFAGRIQICLIRVLRRCRQRSVECKRDNDK